MEKMRTCFEKEFGYLAIPVGMNVTSQQLNLIIGQVQNLKLPKSYRRVVVYFFGHGSDDSVKFADKYVERQYIISKFQAICPLEESNVFKIFFFDSCRSVTWQPLKETGDHGSQAGNATWKMKGQYPASKNTLVINATEHNCDAFYLVKKGCGLMTHFFAELAPTRNESLRDLLVAVRQEIVAFKTSIGNPQDTQQVLVYEDNLMGVVNLLAESRGNGKVLIPF